MRSLLLSATLGAVMLGVPAFADPVGVWTVTSESPQGPSTSTMTVTLADGAHSLTYEGVAGASIGTSLFSDLKVEGDHVTFERTVSSAQLGADIVLDYDITVDGDTLAGTAKPQNEQGLALLGDSVALTGTRN
jgi:hypothetical protein